MNGPCHRGAYETTHAAASTLRYHRHGISFATIVIEASYTELRDGEPETYGPGAVVMHDSSEEHADYFTSACRCLNVVLPDGADRASLGRRASASERPIPDWLQAAIDTFGWATDEPLRGAARLAGVHPVHFSREFHRFVGMTSNAFRRRARVRRASDLLLSTDRLLAHIAHDCGFSDQSHLTRAFGAATGLTPNLYRSVFTR
jgi:transcriptional regulator GlxA family with amidase domain